MTSRRPEIGRLLFAVMKEIKQSIRRDFGFLALSLVKIATEIVSDNKWRLF